MTERQKRKRQRARRRSLRELRKHGPDYAAGDMVIFALFEIDPEEIVTRPGDRKRAAQLMREPGSGRWWVAFDTSARPPEWQKLVQWDQAWIDSGWEDAAQYQKAPAPRVGYL